MKIFLPQKNGDVLEHGVEMLTYVYSDRLYILTTSVTRFNTNTDSNYGGAGHSIYKLIDNSFIIIVLAQDFDKRKVVHMPHSEYEFPCVAFPNSHIYINS